MPLNCHLKSHFAKIFDKKILAIPEPIFENKTISKYIEEIPQTTIDNYTKYWKTIQPITDDDYYKRWVFAFLSVHTSWKANVKSYLKITKEEPEFKSSEGLRNIISYAGVGLINMRTKGIWKFKEDFYKDPTSWRKCANESWDQFRHRTMNMTFGLGYAKAAFAIELCYPNDCEVACLDTHMLQLYGAKTGVTPSPSKYKTLEQHWVNQCKARNIPPFMARNVYWDKVQSQNDTRYWSYVFEGNGSDKQGGLPEAATDKVQQSNEVQNTNAARA